MTRDPGLQPERTVLAWRRTALHYTVVALLATRLAVVRDRPAGLVAAVGLWLAAVVVCQCRRSRRLIALTVLGYAVLGVLLIW